MRNHRRWAWLSLCLVGLTGTLAGYGQLDPDPGLNPLVMTVSDYAVHDRGGATDTAMVTFALAAFALAAVRCHFLLVVFGVAMLVAAIFPTDLGAELSTAGYIHRYASLTAFLALPLAAVLLRPGSRLVRWLVAASGLSMLAMLASATIGDRLLIGLAERPLLLAELALLGVLAGTAGPLHGILPMKARVAAGFG